MFGAPIGIQAAVHGQATQAQAQLYQAEAGLKNVELQNQQIFQSLAAGNALAREKAAQGEVATIGDLRDGKPPSQAQPLEALIASANKIGMSPTVTAAYALKAAEIRKYEAGAAYQQAETQDKQFQMQQHAAEVMSSFASAALNNPDQYEQLRLQAGQMGLPVDQLPPTFNAHAMTAMRDEGMKAKDLIAAQQTAARDASTAALHRSTMAKNDATVAVSKVRERLIKDRAELIEKNGGEGSASQVAARDALTQVRKAKTAALDRKEFPLAPIDPGQRMAGQTYTAANGQKFVWQKDGSGKGVAVLIPNTRATPAVLDAPNESDTIDEEAVDE